MKSYHESIEYDINHSTYGNYLLEKYDIKEEIYRSALSHIYMISDQKGNTLLLKAVKLDPNISFDIKTAMKLKHPGISKIHEYGRSDQFLFIIKDYVEGIDLEQYIMTNGPISSDKAKVIIKKIANILTYLHEFDDSCIIYRDLKPSNIVITPEDKIFLIDIITLRTVKEQSTDTFYVASKGFSAPEQYGYSQTTETADIYALGATLFYFLTGLIPDNKTPLKTQLIKANRFSDTDYMIIKKSMQFNPAKRYSSVSAMIKDYNRNYKLIKRLLYVSATTVLAVLLTVGWVSQTSQPNETTSPDIIIEEDRTLPSEDYNNPDIQRIVKIDTGISFQLDEDNILTINFDRTLLDPNLKDFSYITTGLSTNNLTLTDLKDHDFYEITKGDGYLEYPNSGIGFSLEGKNNLGLVMYNKESKTLGYYIYNNIQLRTPSNMISYSSETDVNMDSVLEITSGISFDLINENSINTKIDKKTINKELADFEFISVWSSSQPFNDENITTYIYDSVNLGRGIAFYNTEGYGSNIENSNHILVLIFNKIKEPLGYYILNEVHESALDGSLNPTTGH